MARIRRLFAGLIGRAITLMVWTLNLPLYYLSRVMPKNPGRWVFACRQGKAFAENAKYLFLHVSQHHPDLEAIWLTRSETVYRDLRGRGLRAYRSYSPQGYWYSMTAGILFLSHDMRLQPDANGYAVAGRTIVFQLWHGSPIKRLGWVRENVRQSRSGRIARELARRLFPFLEVRTSWHRMLAACPEMGEYLAACYNLGEENMCISGYPKNDQWLSRSREALPGTKRFIFMPTFREEDWRLFADFGFDLDRLNRRCAEHDAEFHIKLHPYSLERVEPYLGDVARQSHIHYCDAPDIYEVLDEFDVLITDYSSIVFDYALSRRPVIFTPFDYESYCSNEVGFLMDYHSLDAGPHARNWLELEVLMFSDPAPYAERLKTFCARYNSCEGSDSSERLVAYARDLLRNGVGDTRAPSHYTFRS